MTRSNELIFSLNAGGVDPRALSRVDMERMRMAGEHPVANWLPNVLGPMSIRPGAEMLATISNQTRQVRFARSTDTKYVLLMSANEMRISSAGVIIQIPNVSTTISSTAWSDVSEGAATATGGATLSFAGTQTNSAKLRQAVTVASADQALENILRIAVARGPLVFRVGTTAGGQELIADTVLYTGTHKIAVTPGAATIYVELRSDSPVTRSVSQIDFEANLTSGDLVIPTPWTWAQLQRLRTWQSVDVIFAGDGVQQQRRIEHRGEKSWSVATYDAYNGPYTVVGGNITMTPGALSGNTTITASEGYFQSGHAGTLIELTQVGKTVTQTLNGEDQATDYVTITGIDAERVFYRTGTVSSFVGTLTLQRSVEVDNPTVWADQVTYVNSAAGFVRTAYDDGQDNLTAHYRFIVKAGDYTSGSVEVTLEYENATQVGQALITSVTSSTVVDVETRVAFGSTSATRIWRIGAWSDLTGWPRVPVIHDDRLHWFDDSGKDYASEVDDFQDFDASLKGDSAPFTRSVSGGSLEGVMWAQSDDRLIVGTSGFEANIQANDFDGALTPTAYTTRKPSRRGCADIESVSHHAGIFYAQRSAKRLYEMSIPSSDTRYRSRNVSRLNPKACASGIVRMAVQLQPETRLYTVLTDGTMTVLSYEIDDDVVAFTTVTIPGGLIEDVCVLPETDQDDIYLVVNRSGNRYHMRLGKEAEQEAVATCTLLDYYKVLTGSISSISGATHLASTTVQIWADGQRRADVTLDASGNASLGATYSRVVYGLNFDAEFLSVKPAYTGQLGTLIGQEKRVNNLGMVINDSCLDGIQVGVKMGDQAARTHPLPPIINGVTRTTNQFYSQLELAPFPLESGYHTDSRVYIKASSQEGPVTIGSLVFDVEANETFTPRR